jgi:hypothetical protein
MASTIKVLANSQTISTSNTNLNARCARVLNTGAAVSLITIYDTESNSQVGTVYLAPNEAVNIVLKSNNVVKANNGTNVFATPISFTN